MALDSQQGLTPFAHAHAGVCLWPVGSRAGLQPEALADQLLVNCAQPASKIDQLSQIACTRAPVQVAKRELALECDYSWEAASQARFKQLVEADKSLAGRVGGTWHCPR
eukprot:scaffold147049_cov20-Tisochrysis_lutea.AAC.2